MGTPRNFGQFAQSLRTLTQVASEISTHVAVQIEKRMRRGFRQGTDAYGRPYAGLKPASIRRGRRPPPLRKFAKFAHARPLPGAGVALIVDHPQAGFHQTGTQHMAKRIVVPDRATPPEWRTMIDRELKRALRMRGLK